MGTNADIVRKPKTTLQLADDTIARVMQEFLRQEFHKAYVDIFGVFGVLGAEPRSDLSGLYEAVRENFNKRFWHSGMGPRFLFRVSVSSVTADGRLLKKLRELGFLFEEIKGQLYCHLRKADSDEDDVEQGVAESLEEKMTRAHLQLLGIRYE